jgi:3-dehydroquinate dehydratase
VTRKILKLVKENDVLFPLRSETGSNKKKTREKYQEEIRKLYDRNEQKLPTYFFMSITQSVFEF